MKTGNVYKVIYDIVKEIPKGRVATYGQIAKLIPACTPRMVGYALANLNATESEVPWHRVINSRGSISRRKHGDGDSVQRLMLESENIIIDSSGRIIEFSECLWIASKNKTISLNSV